jgi:hypothetical protein
VRERLPLEQQRQIESTLPNSVDLQQTVFRFCTPLVGEDEPVRKAQMYFLGGWHLLNESRFALIEAESCRIWYEELKKPTRKSSALWFQRYYLDDAALRLYSSCSHILKAIKLYWGLEFGKKRRGQTPVIETREALQKKLPRSRVVIALRAIESSVDWAQCASYRNRWVHEDRPAVVGLEATSRSTWTRIQGTDFEGYEFGRTPLTKVSLGQFSVSLRDVCRLLFVGYRDTGRVLARKVHREQWW